MKNEEINNETLIKLHFPNGEISCCHVWNRIDLNNGLISN